jgi:hypothetical protein
MNVNSYALFGARKNDFAGGLAINLRQHLTMYPDWGLWVYTDEELPDTGYCAVLRRAAAEGLLRITVVPERQAVGQRWKCLMMLWRLLPLWESTNYVFCRDLDSILTPRQLQCVRTFIQSGKTAHGISDNVQHNIALMGGMCGFRTDTFRVAVGVKSLNELLQHSYPEHRWKRHGSDQDFLMEHVWPRVRHNSLIHALRGPNCRSGIKRVTDADISDIPAAVRERGDDFTNYIGAVGTQTDHMGSFSVPQIAEFYNEHGSPKCSILTRLEKEAGYVLL